ncbi:MAG: universal stress protein [Synechococcales cyanobacterium T60_A2020_003]|nr:universal stress protein [Synechococcales cyanobacterium T60_A2020_003]
MFHKIVAAVDLSPVSDSIVERALFLAKVSHAQLALFYLFSLEEESNLEALKLNTLEECSYGQGEGMKCYRGHPTADIPSAVDSLPLNFLQTHIKHASVEHVNAEFYICVGNQAGSSICAFAQDWQADLIVLGHRGRSGLAELLLGSVSNYVVHHAPCSVHIVNRQAKSPAERSP